MNFDSVMIKLLAVVLLLLQVLQDADEIAVGQELPGCGNARMSCASKRV